MDFLSVSSMFVTISESYGVIWSYVFGAVWFILMVTLTVIANNLKNSHWAYGLIGIVPAYMVFSFVNGAVDQNR